MRFPVSFVLGVLLTLGGCGDGDTVPKTIEEGRGAPVEEPAAEPTVEPKQPQPEPDPAPEAAPAPAPEPQKGGDEDFQPPPNWCGTPGMWKKPARPSSGGFVVYVNDAGEELHIPLEALTPQKLRELRRYGWRVGWRIRIGK